MADKNYVLDQVWAARLPKMWRWMRNLRVTGAADFRNTEDNCSISIPAPPVAPEPAAAAKLPTGQYQYQSYQMVAQNEAGWDFDSLHPPVI